MIAKLSVWDTDRERAPAHAARARGVRGRGRDDADPVPPRAPLAPCFAAARRARARRERGAPVAQGCRRAPGGAGGTARASARRRVEVDGRRFEVSCWSPSRRSPRRAPGERRPAAAATHAAREAVVSPMQGTVLAVEVGGRRGARRPGDLHRRGDEDGERDHRAPPRARHGALRGAGRGRRDGQVICVVARRGVGGRGTSTRAAVFGQLDQGKPRGRVFSGSGGRVSTFVCSSRWQRRPAASTTGSWSSTGLGTGVRAGSPLREELKAHLRGQLGAAGACLLFVKKPARATARRSSSAARGRAADSSPSSVRAHDDLTGSTSPRRSPGGRRESRSSACSSSARTASGPLLRAVRAPALRGAPAQRARRPCGSRRTSAATASRGTSSRCRTGLYFGRVGPRDAAAVVDELAAGRIRSSATAAARRTASRCRPRSGVCEETGLRGRTDPRLAGGERTAQDAWRVVFRTGWTGASTSCTCRRSTARSLHG